MDNEQTVLYKENGVSNHTNQMINIFDGEKSPYVVDLKSFSKNKITFGKSEDNDIVLTSSLISRHHGYFLIENDKCFIYDDNSSNGIFVNGESIKAHQLKEGDIIKVDNLENPLEKGVTILFSDLVLTDDWKTFDIENKDKITIGRSSENDISLDHVSVSLVHAIIEKRSDGYYIVDQDSTNGLSVNGIILKEKKLKEKDIITITNSKIIYTKKHLNYCCFKSGVGVDCIDIVKTVKTKNGDKNISDHITLSVKPCEFVAIVGGSGAGKTTFMNCMSGYNRATSGQVIVNGDDLYSNYEVLKTMIGYVPQQDIVYDNLKLWDMLYYAAELRMPKDTSHQEKNKRIQEVIDTVELTGKEKTFINRLSGGQKKRASIAVELLSDPNLFFLDEPSSGLDPGTERNLMKTMKNMARSGKTIILVTHNTLNLHLCDKIIFLGKGGKLCFCGSYQEALEFFQVDNLVDVYNMLNDDTDKWKKSYSSSKYVTKLQYGSAKKTKSYKKKSKESFIKQTLVLSKRYLNLVLNDKQRLLILLLQAPLLSFLISIVADDNSFTQYEMTKSILFALSCSAFWIGILNSIQEVCKEKVILKREYMTGLRLTSYIASKLLVLGLMCLIQTILLVSVFVIFVGLPDKGLILNPFIEFLITTFLTMFSASAMGIFVSSIFKNSDRAMTVAPILLMPQILFSGLVFKLEGLSQQISILANCRWAMEGYGTIANLNSLELRLQKDIPTLVHEAEDFFNYTARHLERSFIVLICFTIIFSIMSIISLRKIDKAD